MSDLPGRADASVARQLSDRRSRPSSKEGQKKPVLAKSPKTGSSFRQKRGQSNYANQLNLKVARKLRMALKMLAGLSFRDAEIAALIVVDPSAGHRVTADFAVDVVMNRPPAVAFGIKFHRDGAGVLVE